MAVRTSDQAQAAIDQYHDLDRPSFELLVVITGVARSPGDPLPSASVQPCCHP